MSDLPKNDLQEPASGSGDSPVELGAREELLHAEAQSSEPALPAAASPASDAFTPGKFPYLPSIDEPPLLPTLSHPPEPPLVRIPHFGHVCLLIPLAGISLLISAILLVSTVHMHLFGITALQQAATDIHYILGLEGVFYLLTFASALFVFPIFWQKSFLAGLQWNGAVALRLRWHLLSAAAVCFVLALVNGTLMPGPTNAPIEKVFQTAGAAWVLFIFGITFAPFFEETLFRGFLLPAFCTAFDWFSERTAGEIVRPLGENGHPQWSFPAMIFGAIATSVPFAWMHAQQTGYSLGPFVLLIGVSLVLCFVRLSTRSLAASVLVHACYNFLLFALMLVGTGGFQHLERL